MCISFSNTKYLDVSALQSEAKSRLLILDEVEGHFWVALLLKIRDDGLAHQLGIAHHMQHLQHKYIMM